MLSEYSSIFHSLRLNHISLRGRNLILFFLSCIFFFSCISLPKSVFYKQFQYCILITTEQFYKAFKISHQYLNGKYYTIKNKVTKIYNMWQRFAELIF